MLISKKALNITSIIEKSLKEWEVQGIQNIITKNEEFKTPNDAQGIKTFGTAEFPTSLKGEYFEGEYMYLSFTHRASYPTNHFSLEN